MESPLLGLILDSSLILEAERVSAPRLIGVADLEHGVVRGNTSEIRLRRRTFIDELKKHVCVHPVTDSSAEIAGQLSGEQAAKGVTLPADDLPIGASAIEQGYAVATLNARHFQTIPGVQAVLSR
jgi:predicted nucleic acid-binding protein